MLWQLVNAGLFKCPRVPYVREPTGFVRDDRTTAQRDLFREEVEVFEHDVENPKPTFGSPFKEKSDGIRGKIFDDSIYSIGWAVFAGRSLFEYRNRRKTIDPGMAFGYLERNPDLSGRY